MSVIHLNKAVNEADAEVLGAVAPAAEKESVFPAASAVAAVSDGNASAGSLLNEGYIRLPEGSTLDPQASERFRIMRARIERLNLAGEEFRLLAVTSAIPEEGKSLVATNLARAMAVDPLGKTILVDCDLRKPSVHRYVGVDLAPGLSDVLVGSKTIASVVRSVEPGLDVITAGSPVVDATRVVELPQLSALLQDLRRRYRYVIVDCPPVLLCPEPLIISSIVDAAVMVVRAWRTERKLVEEAVNLIGKEKFLGAVMNGGADVLNEYGYYGYYSYEIRPSNRKPNGQAASKTSNFLSRLFSSR